MRPIKNHLFRIVKYACLAYIGYLVIAVSLGFFGVIYVIPLAPGWKLKTPHYSKKAYNLHTEPPLVFYQNESIHVVSIANEQNTFIKKQHSYPGNDSLVLKVNTPENSFKVRLKDSFAPAQDTYALPERLLCLSDIEGNFEGLVRFLKGTGVVDQDLAWQYGTGHLVLLGDFFDRGTQVNECLWLIYKLEQEAARAGGKLHFILGNHETMNLMGAYDARMYKYVHGSYFKKADFLKIDYSQWYTPDTALGRWLRSKNSIVKIGDYLFVHGGVSPQLVAAGLRLEQINSGIREGLDKTPNDQTKQERLLLRTEGPLWYRGLANESLTAEEVSRILDAFDSTKIIIGHSVFDQVQTLYTDQVIGIDLKHAENQHVYGLLYNASGFHAINDQNTTRFLMKAY